jgi:hypothetical protein
MNMLTKFSRRSILNALLMVGIPAAALGIIIPESAKAERQPRMEAAFAALNTSLRELELATSDKGGHRVKAISLVKQAMDEVQRGIRFDNRNRR